LGPVAGLPSLRLCATGASKRTRPAKKKREDEDALFVKTLLPHQLTMKPPLGSWSVKKMVISERKVPVRQTDINNLTASRKGKRKIQTAI
jgi:hypothetical protein